MELVQIPVIDDANHRGIRWRFGGIERKRRFAAAVFGPFVEELCAAARAGFLLLILFDLRAIKGLVSRA